MDIHIPYFIEELRSYLEFPNHILDNWKFHTQVSGLATQAHEAQFPETSGMGSEF